MSTTTVRVNEETRNRLRELSEQLGKPMQEVLATAVEAYRRHHILEQTNIAYAKLRKQPDEWSEIERERAEWDSTLADGLDES